jgi:large subunit ribosomal protein L19
MKAQKYTRETIANIGVYDRGFPDFKVGDCIEVGQNIKEGDKERIQYFEGDVIAIRNNAIATTFTVRRIDANGVAVERIFPYYTPAIASIKFIHRGDVVRAKLYYMRKRIGKAARVPEKVLTKDQKDAQRAQLDAKKLNK